jgi:hypothetical protein
MRRSWKTSVGSLGLAGAFVLSAGLSESVNAQTRGRNYPQRNEGRRGTGVNPVTGNIDNNGNGIDDRYEANGQVDRNQNRIPDNQEGYNRNGRNRSNRGDWNRNGVNDRYEVDRNRNGVYDGYERKGSYRNRGYGNDGYYGNSGYGNNSAEYQKGFRDGSQRGREDAQTNRIMDPNNSSHYRKGNAVYRQGFEQGFYQSYRQYSGRRW